MIRTLRRAVLLLALVAAAYVGFRWGPAVFPRIEAYLGRDDGAEADAVVVEPSPELADATLDRFERFRRGEAGDRLALGSAELTSVIRYALPGILPPGVDRPEVDLSDGRVTVSAWVATAAFPDLPDLGSVVGFLPDTVPVDIRGGLEPYDQTHLALEVDRVRAARIPLPPRMVGEFLGGLGSVRRPSMSDDALAVPLPDGLESVVVEGDSLVMRIEKTGP